MASFADRLKILKKIETNRKSKAILYVTGDRKGLETQISKEVIDLFVDHLDAIGPVPKISLILHTNGGSTAAAWTLTNLIRTFCEELEVLIPLKALSSGTLISLGADKIVMTKQATLGPIDPSFNGPLNPQIPGAAPNVTAPVSVEAVRGYLDAAMQELKISESRDLATILTHLADKVHPLVLGQVFRTRTQIRDVAAKLLKRQVPNEKKAAAIIDFLCSDSGSHDHTINRREGVDLGLKIQKPSKAFYALLKTLNDSYRDELDLMNPFDSTSFIGSDESKEYKLPRCMVESIAGGSHHFVTEGKVAKVEMPQGNGKTAIGIQDNRSFEGWRKQK